MTSVTVDRRFGVNSGKAMKVACRAATTANITLAGEQTIDGVACVTADRVLVKNQTTASQNGIYLVDTGAWTRSVDFNDVNDVAQGSAVYVASGTANTKTIWAVATTGTIVPDTTSITFSLATNAPNSANNYLSSISGTNTITGTLSNLTSYVVGQQFSFIPANTNSGATTLNISSIGAGAVKLNGSALTGGELVQNVPVDVVVTATTPVFEIIANGSFFPKSGGTITGDTGVGLAPLQRLHVYKAISGGAPAASGSAAEPNAAFRTQTTPSVFDIGVYASGQTWFQTRLASNYATNYDLIINPNGRDVFVGGTSITTAVGYVGASSTAKCYVIFDGTGAGPITPISGVNSTSITKNSTGNYTINYSTNISAADNTISYSFGTTGYFLTVVSQTASSVRISIKDAGGTETDLSRIMITVFGI